MPKNVCGIQFRTSKGSQLCRTMRDNAIVLLLISLAWVIFCLFLQFSVVFAVQASSFFLSVVMLTIVGYVGISQRSVALLNCFYFGNLFCCIINVVILFAIMIGFYILNGQQFVGPKSGNITACEQKIPDSSNTSTGATPRENGNPLPCSFYSGMTSTMIALAAASSFLFCFCNCTLYVLGLRMHEAVSGSRRCPVEAEENSLQNVASSGDTAYHALASNA